jgi:hypothetical protein
MLRLHPQVVASVFNLARPPPSSTSSMRASTSPPTSHPLQPCPPPRCAATPGPFYPHWCRPSPINHNPNFNPWTLPPPPTLIRHVPPLPPTLESESPASTSLKEESHAVIAACDDHHTLELQPANVQSADRCGTIFGSSGNSAPRAAGHRGNIFSSGENYIPRVDSASAARGCAHG